MSAISTTEASGPKRGSTERYWAWAVIILSLPGVISLGFLPLARMPFERIPESVRPLVYFAFDVGLVSKYFSFGAAFVALLGLLWRGLSWRVKVGLLVIAVLSSLAAVYAGNDLTSCLGGRHL